VIGNVSAQLLPLSSGLFQNAALSFTGTHITQKSIKCIRFFTVALRTVHPITQLPVSGRLLIVAVPSRILIYVALSLSLSLSHTHTRKHTISSGKCFSLSLSLLQGILTREIFCRARAYSSQEDTGEVEVKSLVISVIILNLV